MLETPGIAVFDKAAKGPEWSFLLAPLRVKLILFLHPTLLKAIFRTWTPIISLIPGDHVTIIICHPEFIDSHSFITSCQGLISHLFYGMLKRAQHDKKKYVIPNLFRNLGLLTSPWSRAVIALPGLEVSGLFLLPAIIAPSQLRLDNVANASKEVLAAAR